MTRRVPELSVISPDGSTIAFIGADDPMIGPAADWLATITRDDGAILLSHEIAREIEDQLEYPGQVKVIVIRESRAIEVAK